MKIDEYGRISHTSDEVLLELYETHKLDISGISLGSYQETKEFNDAITDLHLPWPKLGFHAPMTSSVADFDASLQSQWFMPDDYKKLDIAQYVLDLCSTDEELQRVAEELLLYQERDMFDVLRFLKYFVDTMREKNLVWGVGRGSSVSSYVLFLLGVHKIDSIYFGLDVKEFLK